MSNNQILKQLCQQLVANQFETIHDAEQALEQFEDLATPGAVLALLTDESGYQQGAKVEADAGDEARSKVRDMKLRESQLVTELKKLRPILERVKAENKALLQDKARLDWFDHLNQALNQHYGTTYRWKVIINHNITRLMLNDLKTVDMSDAEPFGLPSCREAIDAAMANGRQS